MAHTKLDKNFKCPKSIKMMCAGRPKSEWRMHFDAVVALQNFRRKPINKKDREEVNS